MNCCHPFTGECQQGHGCPVRATRQHTCAQLGICNCSSPACLQQSLPDDDLVTDRPSPVEQIAYWAAVVVSSALTVGVLAGIAGYFAARAGS